MAVMDSDQYLRSNRHTAVVAQVGYRLWTVPILERGGVCKILQTQMPCNLDHSMHTISVLIRVLFCKIVTATPEPMTLMKGSAHAVHETYN
jgi:hypothetical protein